MTFKHLRARCPGCGRIVAVGIPKGGDGSVDIYRAHPPSPAERCSYSRAVVHVRDYVEED